MPLPGAATTHCKAAPEFSMAAQIRNQFFPDIDLGRQKEFNHLCFSNVCRRIGRAYRRVKTVMIRRCTFTLAGDQGHIASCPLKAVFQHA